MKVCIPIPDMPKFELLPGDIVVAIRNLPADFRTGLGKPVPCGTRGTVRSSFFSIGEPFRPGGTWYRIHWDPNKAQGFNYLEGDHVPEDIGYSLNMDGTDAKWRRRQYD